ncbi:hypothetical protein RQP46_001305 [Phenoliferia psychrophenolica]
MAPRRRFQTSITSLPTELLTLIVSASAPSPSWSHDRLSHLSSLALVSRAFLGPAQQELFRHVLLPTIAASRAYCAVLKSRTGGARFALTARSLRAGTETDQEPWMTGEIDEEKWGLPFIARKCLRLEEIWLLEIGPIDMESVASGPVLKALHCRSCRFLPSIARKKKVPKLALTRLTLSHCDHASFLRPASLPFLKSLAFTSDPLSGGPVSWDHIIHLPQYHGPVTTLAPQLEHLCLDAVTSTYLSPHFGLFTNLTTLDTRFLWDTGNLEFFVKLPTQLRHLRVRPAPGDPALGTDDPTGSSHALAFMHKHLEDITYSSLSSLAHLRLAGSCILRPLFALKLRKARPKLLLTYDDDRDGTRMYEHTLETAANFDAEGLLPPQPVETGAKATGAKFNPEFWTLVDDAEERLRNVWTPLRAMLSFSRAFEGKT